MAAAAATTQSPIFLSSVLLAQQTARWGGQNLFQSQNRTIFPDSMQLRGGYTRVPQQHPGVAPWQSINFRAPIATTSQKALGPLAIQSLQFRPLIQIPAQSEPAKTSPVIMLEKTSVSEEQNAPALPVVSALEFVTRETVSKQKAIEPGLKNIPAAKTTVSEIKTAPKAKTNETAPTEKPQTVTLNTEQATEREAPIVQESAQAAQESDQTAPAITPATIETELVVEAQINSIPFLSTDTPAATTGKGKTPPVTSAALYAPLAADKTSGDITTDTATPKSATAFQAFFQAADTLDREELVATLQQSGMNDRVARTLASLSRKEKALEASSAASIGRVLLAAHSKAAQTQAAQEAIGIQLDNRALVERQVNGMPTRAADPENDSTGTFDDLIVEATIADEGAKGDGGNEESGGQATS